MHYNPVRHALDVVRNKIMEDPDYRKSWITHIAKEFKDEWQTYINAGIDPKEIDVHVIANNAAENFVELLFNDLPRGETNESK